MLALKQSLAIATALLINGVFAGAGASVKACIWFSTKPHTAIQFYWNTCGTSSHCMYCKDLGNPSMWVSEAGLTCVDLGKVESKSSTTPFVDTCATDQSHWELSYNSATYSGSVSSRWMGGGAKHNYITFDKDKYSPGTTICGSKSACVGTDIDWDRGNAPDLYYVFRPQQQKAFNSWEGQPSEEHGNEKVQAFYNQADL
ncbi:hypothetical protein V8C42DRAFT_313937 [Trichoderma barbatum]